MFDISKKQFQAVNLLLYMTKKSVKLTAEKVQKIIKDILFRRLVELERYDFLQTAPMVFKAIKKTLQILFANNHKPMFRL